MDKDLLQLKQFTSEFIIRLEKLEANPIEVLFLARQYPYLNELLQNYTDEIDANLLDEGTLRTFLISRLKQTQIVINKEAISLQNQQPEGDPQRAMASAHEVQAAIKQAQKTITQARRAQNRHTSREVAKSAVENFFTQLRLQPQSQVKNSLIQKIAASLDALPEDDKSWSSRELIIAQALKTHLPENTPEQLTTRVAVLKTEEKNYKDLSLVAQKSDPHKNLTRALPRLIITSADHGLDPREVLEVLDKKISEGDPTPIVSASKEILSLMALRVDKIGDHGESFVARTLAASPGVGLIFRSLAPVIDTALTLLPQETRTQIINQAVSGAWQQILKNEKLLERLETRVGGSEFVRGILEAAIRDGSAERGARSSPGTLFAAASNLINDMGGAILRSPTREAIVSQMELLLNTAHNHPDRPLIQKFLKYTQLQAGATKAGPGDATTGTPQTKKPGIPPLIMIMALVYANYPDNFQIKTDTAGNQVLGWGVQAGLSRAWEWVWDLALGKAAQVGAGEGARRVGGGFLGWLLARLGGVGAGAAGGGAIGSLPGAILGAVAGLLGGAIVKRVNSVIAALSEGRVGPLKMIIDVLNGRMDKGTRKGLEKSDKALSLTIICIILAAIFLPAFIALGKLGNDQSVYLAQSQGGVSGSGAPGGGSAVDCSKNPNSALCTFKPCATCKWPASGYITQGPNVACTKDASHASGSDANGIDIAAPGNVGVYSVTSGTVLTVWSSCGAGGLGNVCGAPGYEGYGNSAIIRSDNGYTLVYAHMDKAINPAIFRGAKVVAGDQIGWMNHSGNSSGQHLHFGVLSGGNVLDLIPDAPIKKADILGCVGASQECSRAGKACPTTPVSAK